MSETSKQLSAENMTVPPFTPEQYPGVPAFDLENSAGEYERGLPYYEKRIEVAGFTGLDAVLDAACGAGQWMLPFALHNRNVTGIDLNRHRLDMAQAIASTNGLENIRVVQGSILELPFEEASFDLVFCRGVLMFTDEDRVIGEFARVLRPGGRIYIFTNAAGWIFYRAWQRGFRRLPIGEILVRLPRLVLAALKGRGGRMKAVKAILSPGAFEAVSELSIALKTLRATMRKRLVGRYLDCNTADTPREMRSLGSKHGLEVEFLGHEGAYRNPGWKLVEQKNTDSPPRFLGLRKHIEIVYRKPGVPA